jgi:hypothetical protein
MDGNANVIGAKILGMFGGCSGRMAISFPRGITEFGGLKQTSGQLLILGTPEASFYTYHNLCAGLFVS